MNTLSILLRETLCDKSETKTKFSALSEVYAFRFKKPQA